MEAIDMLADNELGSMGAVSITSDQRLDVVRAIGSRFPHTGYPIGVWCGNRHSWEAADFVSKQILQLAADTSLSAGDYLRSLEDDPKLISYRDLVRHQRAQQEKQQRELGFIFAPPDRIARVLKNEAPATPNDLLAFVVDHCTALSQELARTQRERYRAYWNEHGRCLQEPKHEETCSGLFANDLQDRLRPHNLIATVERHMVADKECDIVILQGTDRLLPIEAKHHYHDELWTAWRTQLDYLYTREAGAGGLGIYLVFWSGEAKGRKMPKLPDNLDGIRPTNAAELRTALMKLIPEKDRYRLRAVVVDISQPRG